MVGFLENISQWIKFLWQRSFCHLLYMKGHQQDQSMLLLHFLLFRLKDEANFEKKKKKATVIALLSRLDQTVLPLPG